MAHVTLLAEEVAPGVFPPTCIVCGSPVSATVRAGLSWVPAWSYLFLLCGFWPFVIVYLIVRRSMTATVPVCARHRRHFLWRQWFFPVGVLATLATLMSPIVAQPDAHPFPPVWALVGTIAVFLGTIAGAVWLRQTGVRVVGIGRDEIALTGVSADFVAALESGRADYKQRMQEWLERRNR